MFLSILTPAPPGRSIYVQATIYDETMITGTPYDL